MRKPRAWVRWVAALGAVWILLIPKSAPATITEQRRRLPPPAHCEDPVAGVWKAHKYNPQFGDWEIFMLRIHRVDGSDTALHGTITNHSWNGGAQQEEPPQCRAGFEWEVSMDAEGTYRVADNYVFFGGIGQWRLDRVFCRYGPSAYNLDRFQGVIDPSIEEFQSTNNDGGRAINIPYVFRRISCFNPEAEHSPTVETSPPEFYPEEQRACSCL